MYSFRNSALEHPGDADITADVNFHHLKVVAESRGLLTTDVIDQKDFLKNMGIATRLLLLLKKWKTTEGKNRGFSNFVLFWI